MTEDAQPVSYQGATLGVPVLSSTGTRFGTLDKVLEIPSEDLFDGVIVATEHGRRFVDRDQISEITTTRVRCAITDAEAASLPAPQGTQVMHPDLAHDEGPSLTAWFGRLFGRTHWKESD